MERGANHNHLKSESIVFNFCKPIEVKGVGGVGGGGVGGGGWGWELWLNDRLIKVMVTK